MEFLLIRILFVCHGNICRSPTRWTALSLWNWRTTVRVRLNTRGPRKYYAKPYDTGISSACLGDVIDGISDGPSLLCYCKALTVVADVKHDFFRDDAFAD